MLVNLQDRGRLLLTDRDRLALIQRMSTNDLNKLQAGFAMPTILTTPVGRIIDLLTLVHDGEQVWAITGSGRGEQIRTYLQRNIFFNDRLKIADVSGTTGLYALYGTDAAQQLAALLPQVAELAENQFVKVDDLYILSVKPLAGAGFWLFGEQAALNRLLDQLKAAGIAEATPADIEPLRIEAGYPAAQAELTEDYIPLEAGLWDAVSFSKGCYTGQEIIARMESRGKLAKMLVRLAFAAPLPAGTPLFAENEKVGTVTSAAAQVGLGYVKTAAVQENKPLTTEDGVAVQIVEIAGVQPGK